MSETVIVALCSLLGSFVAGYFSGSKTVYRIDQLEKKVEKHNNLIERTYKLEEHQSIVDEQIKVANHRIKDLERNEE